MTAHLFDLAITGNMLVEGRFVEGGTLLVDEGRVSGIIDSAIPFQSKTHLRADGKWMLPRVVGGHVHWLKLSRRRFSNSTQPGAAGGVTTIIDMPVDAPSGTATPEALQKKIDLVERESFIDVALTGVG